MKPELTESPLRTPCPLHPANGSIATCERCGTFMCAQCVGPEGASICPTCAEQSFSFPLTRSDWSVSGLFGLCMEAFKPQWLMLSVAFVVFVVAYYAMSMVGGLLAGLIGAVVGEASEVAAMVIAVALVGVSVLASALLSLGFNRICLDVLQGKQVSIGALFSQMGSLHLVVKLWGVLGVLYGGVFGGIVAMMAVATEAAGLIGILIFIPFGIVFGIATMLLMVGFVVHPELGFVAHVKRTAKMLGGGEIFGCIGLMFVSGLIVFAGALLCGIGMIPAYGLSMMLMVGLYLALENDPAFDTSRTMGLDTIR